jgi:hypothetical protein
MQVFRSKDSQWDGYVALMACLSINDISNFSCTTMHAADIIYYPCMHVASQYHVMACSNRVRDDVEVELVPDAENGSSAPHHNGASDADGAHNGGQPRRGRTDSDTLEGGPPVGLKPGVLESGWCAATV